MSQLSIGIVGLPNVGKSTLFNALSNNDVLAANYPFATIEPNKGIVPVPDEKIQTLAELYNPKSVVPATVTFFDIAGLVKGASQGDGLGNQFLAHIRSTNAIAHLVRAFSDTEVTAAGSTSPEADIEIINTELILADLQTVENRLPKLEKEVRADPKIKPILDSLVKVKQLLASGKLALSDETIEREHIYDLNLLTAKPMVFVFNLDDSKLSDDELKAKLSQQVLPNRSIFVSAKLESELRGLDIADQQELLQSYGQKKSGLDQLIHQAYEVLGLQSFYTAGEKEVRAWTIKKGSTAPEAAGAIHTDFQRGFIAAQVIDFDDLVKAGSVSVAKAAGKVRTEGKDYILKPNDVVEFRFNV